MAACRNHGGPLGCAVLVWVIVQLLSAQIAGQGLRLDDASKMGATGRVNDVMKAYSEAKTRASDMQKRYAALSSTSCKTNSAKLCGSIATSDSSEQEALSLMVAPDFYDSRLKEHTGGVSLVREPDSQGSCSACVAFAVASAAESAIAAGLHQDISTIPRLSPRSLFFCPETGAAKADCSAGGFLSDALGDLTTRLYVMPDLCLPWSGYQGKQSDLCKSSCSDARLQTLTAPILGKFTWTTAQPLNSIPAIQRHIRQWGSVVTRFELHYDELLEFVKKNPLGVYDTDKKTGGQPHAVAIVGYNNAENYWIVKQSYGSKFAQGGFHKVRYGAAGIGDPSSTYGIFWERQERRDRESRAGRLAQFTSPAGEDCFLYQTQPGDFIERVAYMFDAKVEHLLEHNIKVIPTERPGVFLPGVKLKICGGQRPAAPPASAANAVAAKQPDAAAATSWQATAANTPEAEYKAVRACKACQQWWSAGLGGANEDVCKLGGVLCDRLGYVQQVTMGRRVLDGSLPDSFGSLAHLETLDFNTNKLSGRLPPNWGSLSKLLYLDLHDNLLNGPLPGTYGSLTALETLDLSQNKLTGTLPAGWAKLKVKLLKLHDNQLEGTVPAEFGAMTKLESISLVHNPKLRGCLPAAWKGRVTLLDAVVDAYVPTVTAGVRKGTMITGFCTSA